MVFGSLSCVSHNSPVAASPSSTGHYRNGGKLLGEQQDNRRTGEKAWPVTTPAIAVDR
ncbi:hypothetical protein U1Q18_027795, partial [Sarracenia purpurea var. burkii]